MRMAVGCLAAVLVLAGFGWGQEADQSQPPQEHKPPTLNPQPGPSLGGGPRTATTNDARKLLRIRTLYVQRMDNSLSDRLLENLAKMGRIRIVTAAKGADAVMRGSCLESRRLKRVHSEIFIADRNGASVWQDDLYRPYNPPTLQKAVEDTAMLVVQHLTDSIRTAEGQ